MNKHGLFNNTSQHHNQGAMGRATKTSRLGLQWRHDTCLGTRGEVPSIVPETG